MFSTIPAATRQSLRALRANKVRSFLTMLGIVIGVGAVIVIMAVGAGAQSLILDQVKSLGTNLIGVLPGKAEEDGPPASVMGIVITTLTYEDALAMRDSGRVSGIVDVVAYSKGLGTVSWGAATYDTNLSGTTVGYLKVEDGEVATGRFFTVDEERNLSRVAVLGHTVKQELFGESDAIGQRIKYRNHSFEVIGVMAERGTVAFQDYDDQILIPIRTMQKIVLGVDHVSMIRAKIDREENIIPAVTEVEALLRDRHDIDDQSGASDDFTVRNAAEALDMITTITNALKYFLAAMAALSLVVGGIGIMNIMLVAVTERTREIGLRKAVGATSAHILLQFLVESVTVTSLGGLIGIAGGSFIAYLVAVVARYLDYAWEFSVSPASIVLAVVVSAGIGIAFGLFPAYRASKLSPVEALRYE